MRFYGTGYSQPGVTNETHRKEINSQLSLKQLHMKATCSACTRWPCPERLEKILATWEEQWNALVPPWQHMHSPVHCVCQRAEVWGPFGRCWKEKMPGSHLRAAALTLGPLGSAAPLLSNPGALASSPGAPGSNTRHRTVEAHLVTERRSRREAVIQFISEKGGQRGTLLWLLGTICSLSSLLCLTLHFRTFINVCPTYWPYMNSTERSGRLVTKQHMSYPCMLKEHWIACPLHFLLKSLSINMWRRSMKTTHSDTGSNEQKTTWPRAPSIILERLMSVPEDPKLK